MSKKAYGHRSRSFFLFRDPLGIPLEISVISSFDFLRGLFDSIYHARKLVAAAY
jgi:hypothetical protein